MKHRGHRETRSEVRRGRECKEMGGKWIRVEVGKLEMVDSNNYRSRGLVFSAQLEADFGNLLLLVNFLLSLFTPRAISVAPSLASVFAVLHPARPRSIADVFKPPSGFRLGPISDNRPRVLRVRRIVLFLHRTGEPQPCRSRAQSNGCHPSHRCSSGGR